MGAPVTGLGRTRGARAGRARGPRARPLGLALGLAVGVALGAAAPAAAARVTFAGATLAVPRGWASHAAASTLSVARGAADLTRGVPARGRLTVVALGCGAVDLNALLVRDTARVTSSAAATRATVGGHAAASISFTSERGATLVVTEAFVVPLARSRAYALTLEAPKSTWAATARAFAPVLSSLRFSASARCP